MAELDGQAPVRTVSPALAAGAEYARDCHMDYARQRRQRYLDIHGPYLTVVEAARQLGIHPRTVVRWRSRLRRDGELGAARG